MSSGKPEAAPLWKPFHLVWMVALVFSTVGYASESAQSISHQVLPVLMQHCWPCHSGDVLDGGLDLRTRATLLQGGKSGSAIVPGKAEESLLIRRIRDGKCPPSQRLVEAGVKPVPAPSIEKLVEWINGGAMPPVLPVDRAGEVDDPLVRPEHRDFWAFVPPKAFPAPAVKRGELVRNPIDAFLLNRLEAVGLGFAGEASKRVLLRRLYFDLTGLPPTPEDVRNFELDSAPDAYERQVDRLLSSPRYGERWGRYWLDVAGYSDVDGKREQHLPRPWAFRFRDYVIRSFNEDKPFDRFLTEQLAGDELVPPGGGGDGISQQEEDCYVATGFLRMGPDPTWANITGFLPDRLEVIADAMDVLGGGVLGLSLRCARCHNHKTDPLPQRDYYRLVDVFKGALDEYAWMKPGLEPYGGAANLGRLGERTLPFVQSEERKRWETQKSGLARRIEEQRERIKTEEKRVREAGGNSVDIARLSTKELAGRDALLKQALDELTKLESKKIPEPRVAALWDRGSPSPTFVYRRGEYQRPGEWVTAGFPAVLSKPGQHLEAVPPWPGSNQTGRRLAFAKWLTAADHPLTSRVFVNRVWKHHFGVGLVRTLDNFGKSGALPSHPELLDWLSSEFVRSGWRVKSLHRLLVTSAAYRQSSGVSVEVLTADPDNRLLSRMPMRRLDAEAVWDSLVSVAGLLDLTPYGPAVPVQLRKDGAYLAGKTGRGWRRSIYGRQTRKEIPVLLEAFDMPSMNPNCVIRSESIVSTQALHLMNDPVVRELAMSFARRVEVEAGGSELDQITRAFGLAFGRGPAEQETEWAREIWRAVSREHLEGGGPLVVLCRALLSSAEFIYVD